MDLKKAQEYIKALKNGEKVSEEKYVSHYVFAWCAAVCYCSSDRFLCPDFGKRRIR